MDLQIAFTSQFLILFRGTLLDDTLGFLLIFGVPSTVRGAAHLCCHIGMEQRRDCAENPVGKARRETEECFNI